MTETRAAIVVTTIFEPRFLDDYLANLDRHGRRESVDVIVIIDRKTYHEKQVHDVDKTPTGNQNNTKKEKSPRVVAGFADGHVEYRYVYEMFDSDVNWTGRFNINNPDTHEPGRAGILWKDFQ